MFAMFADDELRHCAWTHPGKRQAKPATKLATAEHHCCSTSLLQLQQQQPLLNVTRRLQHNLKVQSQKSHRFRFGCATKIATALLGNIGGLAKKRRLVDDQMVDVFMNKPKTSSDSESSTRAAQSESSSSSNESSSDDSSSSESESSSDETSDDSDASAEEFLIQYHKLFIIDEIFADIGSQIV